jgi:hypothetical protein
MSLLPFAPFSVSAFENCSWLPDFPSDSPSFKDHGSEQVITLCASCPPWLTASHEIHQKHRHASARGLLDHRWPSRVRFECWASHLPSLHCSDGRWRLHSHRQIAGTTSNICRTMRPSDPFDQPGAQVLERDGLRRNTRPIVSAHRAFLKRARIRKTATKGIPHRAHRQ